MKLAITCIVFLLIGAFTIFYFTVPLLMKIIILAVLSWGGYKTYKFIKLFK